MKITTKWISVKDRLPDYNKMVLLTIKRKGKQSIHVGKLEKDSWYIDSDSLSEYLITNDNITHWTNLPSTPSIVKEK